jgi:AcrR family transcriptional regulator
MSSCSLLSNPLPRRLFLSPRGVAIPELREQLFRATEQVLARDGAAGLTGRAITREAGCATGLLYNHFGDLDDFLAEFLSDRMRSVAESNKVLLSRVGENDVPTNLTAFALARFTPGMRHAASLALTRPALADKLRTARGRQAPPLQTAEPTLVDYLRSEQDRGRLHARADPEAIALALIGAIHHLLLSQPPGTPAPEAQLRRLAITLTIPPACPPARAAP